MQMGMPPRYQSPGMSSGGPGGRGGGSYRGGGGMYQPRGGGWYAKQQMMAAQNVTYDGKRMRKAVYRKTVDYNSSIVNYLENRIWQRDHRDQRMLGAHPLYSVQMVPPPYLKKQPMNCVTTKFIRTSTNKIRCPIFCVCWTPEGRRLITGASSGEFTLWNGLTFNFETILQAHDSSVRSMVWSHNDLWMLTADHAGFIKYWQSNMNNVKMFQAHKDPVRGLSFCPTDSKFASCSDDGTVRVWDFQRHHEERILRGHGADVKCVDWHPVKSLLASGSKDTQQPVKLWDARMGTSLATIHAHKHTVMEVKWNKNGNWLLTASRDHLLKLFDIRKMKEELQTFKGHKKEATTVAWHPIHESLFTSGGSDGAIMFWLVGHDKEVGSIDEAHETMVWSLAWHPLGHILASGSNDHTTKFWTRNRVGDRMRDKYNLNTLPLGTSEDMLEFDNDFSMPSIPGMGLEFGLPEHLQASTTPATPATPTSDSGGAIPGFGVDPADLAVDKPVPKKKVPYAKPIPKNFEQAWESGAQPNMLGGADANTKPKASTPAPAPSPAPTSGPTFRPPGPPPSGPFSQPPPRGPPPTGPPPRGTAAPPRPPYSAQRHTRPPPPQHYGQGSSYPSYNASQGEKPPGGNDQWSGAESWRRQDYPYQTPPPPSDYQNDNGSLNGSSSYGGGYDGGYGRGRGRGRGQGGYGQEHAPSLLDMPMSKRSWDKGPGEGDNGAWGGEGGDGGHPPSKYGRADGQDGGPPQDGYNRGHPSSRPPFRGGRPPMRGAPRGGPGGFRGGRPPMRGGRGGRGGRGRGW